MVCPILQGTEAIQDGIAEHRVRLWLRQRQGAPEDAHGQVDGLEQHLTQLMVLFVEQSAYGQSIGVRSLLCPFYGLPDDLA
jgi:hypothetical protein